MRSRTIALYMNVNGQAAKNGLRTYGHISNPDRRRNTKIPGNDTDAKGDILQCGI